MRKAALLAATIGVALAQVASAGTDWTGESYLQPTPPQPSPTPRAATSWGRSQDYVRLASLGVTDDGVPPVPGAPGTALAALDDPVPEPPTPPPDARAASEPSCGSARAAAEPSCGSAYLARQAVCLVRPSAVYAIPVQRARVVYRRVAAAATECATTQYAIAAPVGAARPRLCARLRARRAARSAIGCYQGVQGVALEATSCGSP